MTQFAAIHCLHRRHQRRRTRRHCRCCLRRQRGDRCHRGDNHRPRRPRRCCRCLQRRSPNPRPCHDDGGGGPTTTPNGPAVVGGNAEVSLSLAMGGAMGGVMSCLCVMCWVSLIRWWHNIICLVCFCIPHPRQFFYVRMNLF